MMPRFPPATVTFLKCFLPDQRQNVNYINETIFTWNWSFYKNLLKDIIFERQINPFYWLGCEFCQDRYCPQPHTSPVYNNKELNGKGLSVNCCQLYKYVALKGSPPLPCNMLQGSSSGETPSSPRSTPRETYRKHNFKTEHEVSILALPSNGNSSLQSNILKLGQTVQLHKLVGNVTRPQWAKTYATKSFMTSYMVWEQPIWRSL